MEVVPRWDSSATEPHVELTRRLYTMCRSISRLDTRLLVREPPLFMTVDGLDSAFDHRSPLPDVLTGHVTAVRLDRNKLSFLIDIRPTERDKSPPVSITFVHSAPIKDDLRALVLRPSEDGDAKDYWSSWSVTFDVVRGDVNITYKTQKPITVLRLWQVLEAHVAVEKTLRNAGWRRLRGTFKASEFRRLNLRYLTYPCPDCYLEAIAGAVEAARSLLSGVSNRSHFHPAHAALRHTKAHLLAAWRPTIITTREFGVRYLSSIFLSFHPKSLKGTIYILQDCCKVTGEPFRMRPPSAFDIPGEELTPARRRLPQLLSLTPFSDVKFPMARLAEVSEFRLGTPTFA